MTISRKMMGIVCLVAALANLPACSAGKTHEKEALGEESAETKQGTRIELAEMLRVACGHWVVAEGLPHSSVLYNYVTTLCIEEAWKHGAVEPFVKVWFPRMETVEIARRACQEEAHDLFEDRLATDYVAYDFLIFTTTCLTYEIQYVGQ